MDRSILPHTKPTEQDALDVKLDIVVNMIDSVTEEMSYYKEKVNSVTILIDIIILIFIDFVISLILNVYN